MVTLCIYVKDYLLTYLGIIVWLMMYFTSFTAPTPITWGVSQKIWTTAVGTVSSRGVAPAMLIFQYRWCDASVVVTYCKEWKTLVHTSTHEHFFWQSMLSLKWTPCLPTQNIQQLIVVLYKIIKIERRQQCGVQYDWAESAGTTELVAWSGKIYHAAYTVQDHSTQTMHACN